MMEAEYGFSRGKRGAVRYPLTLAQPLPSSPQANDSKSAAGK